MLAGLTPEHFDEELHRRARAHLVEASAVDEELLPFLAELDARAAAEEIDVETGKELLLRLRERHLRRELQTADLDRTRELQAALTKIRQAVSGIA